MDNKKHLSDLTTIDWEYELYGEKWVRLVVDDGDLASKINLMSYASYLMILKLNRWLVPGEFCISHK